jgi:hypothetical protein
MNNYSLSGMDPGRNCIYAAAYGNSEEALEI